MNALALLLNQNGAASTGNTLLTPRVVIGETGQSNEVGRGSVWTWATPAIAGLYMLGNDELWKALTPVADDDTGQTDTVSIDANAEYNHGYDLASWLLKTTGKEVDIIARPKGETSSTDWQPNVSDYDDRTTLFGNALYSFQKTAQRTPQIITHFQGENDVANGAGEVAGWAANTTTIFNTFRTQLGNQVNPFTLASESIYFVVKQLGCVGTETALRQTMRENQRAFVNGYARSVLIPTHDLGLIDTVHIDAEGQREIARREAWAILRSYKGDTGYSAIPTISSIAKPTSTTVTVTCNVNLRKFASPDDLDYWVVDSGAGSHTVTDYSVTANVITLTLSAAHSGTVVCTYRPPSRGAGPTPWKRNVVQSLDAFPIPCFTMSI